jgi:amidase
MHLFHDWLRGNSGLPAITVPGGFTPNGLPVGLQLLRRAWSEPQLIKIAYAYGRPHTTTVRLPAHTN